MHTLGTTVVHNTADNSSDNFPLILQTIITAQILSTEGVGDIYKLKMQKLCKQIYQRQCHKSQKIQKYRWVE